MPRRSPTVVATCLASAVLALAGCSGGNEQVTPQAGASSSATASTPAPSTTDTALPPAAQGLVPCPRANERRFALRSGDERVTGFVRGKGGRVAILSHQSRGTPCDLGQLGSALADAGYRVVLWTTESGSSTHALRSLIAHERSRGASWVALVGASIGGATSVVATAGTRPPVDAVVALSPSSQADTGGDVERAAARYRGPLMVIAGQYDPSFAELPAVLARVHDGPEEVEVVPGSGDHGKDFVSRTTDPMTGRVIAFLAGTHR